MFYILTVFPSIHSLEHPLEGLGYQFWSGIGSDFGEATLVASVVAMALMVWHHINCHEHRCLRLAWHKDKDGHPICKVHHPDHPAKSWFRSDKSHPRHAAQKKKNEGN